VCKVARRTDVQTSGIPGSAVVRAPYPAGRELELFNVVQAKYVLPKPLPWDIIDLSMHGAGKGPYDCVAEFGGLKADPYQPAMPFDEFKLRTAAV
jgi:hypothetical protein